MLRNYLEMLATLDLQSINDFTNRTLFSFLRFVTESLDTHSLITKTKAKQIITKLPGIQVGKGEFSDIWGLGIARSMPVFYDMKAQPQVVLNFLEELITKNCADMDKMDYTKFKIVSEAFLLQLKRDPRDSAGDFEKVM